jgi:hypothetical protein
MTRVGIGVKETHGNPRHALRLERQQSLARRGLIERHERFAQSIQSLGHLEPQIARHERRRLRVEQVVDLGAVAAAQLEHVAEALGRDQADARALLLHDGVDHGRRAMDDRRQIRQIEPQSLEAFEESLLQLPRRRHLLQRNRARRLVEQHQVDERTTHIYG